MQIDAMNQRDLQERTKRFAFKIIGFWESLPKDETCKTLGRQHLRSATSVGANYRAVCRAKSKPDFISKFGTVLEEADESAFWIELLIDAKKVKQQTAQPLLQEANELIAIAISSINTARRVCNSAFCIRPFAIRNLQSAMPVTIPSKRVCNHRNFC